MASGARSDPLYARVYESLARRIASGELRGGTQLPPERELCDELQVSRATIRKAIAMLTGEGVLYPVQGRGTFVAGQGRLEPPATLLSFSRLAAERGLTPGAVPLTAVVRPASFGEAERLRIAPGAEVFDLERLRTLDGVPVALDHSIVPLGVAPLLQDADWTTTSLYECLSAAGAMPVRSDWTITAQAADALCSQHLELPVGEPILRAESVNSTLSDRVVELGSIRYRGDRYQLRTTVIETAPPLVAGTRRAADR